MWGGRADEDEDRNRSGVSVVSSREGLAAYLGGPGQGIPFGLPGWLLVELEGEESDDTPLDAEFGEVLIHPERVVSVAPIDDAFFQMVGEAADFIEARGGFWITNQELRFDEIGDRLRGMDGMDWVAWNARYPDRLKGPDGQWVTVSAAVAPGDPPIQGSTPEELEAQATLIEEAVAAALAVVSVQAAASVLGAVPGFVGTAVVAAPWVSLDDVATVPTMWLRQVDGTVVPLLRGILDEQAEDVRDQIQAVVDAQPGIYGVPSLTPGEPPVVPTVPDIPNVTSDQLMAQAHNRLVGIGDLLWLDIRQQLTEGIAAGETVEQLAKRVEATAGVAEPRARTIARTETIAVSNGASMAQARSAGFPMRKTWLATDDERTRLWHVEADNQTVGIDDLFQVGPDFLDYPGDPTGSPGNVINCRCGIGFTLLGLPAPVTAAVGAKTAADPWVRDADGQFAKTVGAILQGATAPVTASIGDAHLPGKHDQSSHGRKGIRKPDTAVTERTRARRSQAERERRDIEAQARREAQEAVDMHAARALAELAIEFEEMIAKGATQRAMTHRVRSSMRRLKLEPSQERAGDVVPYDPGRHQPIGGNIPAGAAVQVVRPGYVWRQPDRDVLIERPIVLPVGDEPVTAAVGRKTADDPYVRDSDGQFAKTGSKISPAQAAERLRNAEKMFGTDRSKWSKDAQRKAKQYEKILADSSREAKPDLSKMKVAELRAEAKRRGLKGLSKAPKEQLVKVLSQFDKSGEDTSPGRPSVDSLKRTRIPSASSAARATNPSFGSTSTGPTYREQGLAGERWTPSLGPLPSGAFEENCTNAVNGFEMRMRGYDVTAAPLDVLSKYGYAAGRTYEETDKLFTDAWTLPGGKPHGRNFAGQKWRSFKAIDAEIERDWPEGGRGVITVGKHIFNVIKVGGKARYIEAQYDATPTRNVTRLYKTRFKGYEGWSEGIQEGKLIRLDDLVPTDGIFESVEVPR